MTYMTAINNPRRDRARKVELQVPQPAKMETFYQLNLTPEEVVTLRVTCNKIGGGPGETIRGYIDSLAAKLPKDCDPSYIDYSYDPSHERWPNDIAIFYGEGSKGAAFQKAVENLR